MDNGLVVKADIPQRIPADAEMADTDVATINLALVRNDGCATSRPYDEVTGPNPAAEIVGCHDCTKPDDALTTVGLLDRLKTVESVTGIVPPDVATITSGADERVTVPLESDVALLRVMTPLDTFTVGALEKVTMPLLRLVGLLSTTVGLLLSVTVPLLSERTR